MTADDRIARIVSVANAMTPLGRTATTEQIEATLRIVSRLVGAEAASLALVEQHENAGALRYVAAVGPGAESIVGQRLELGRGLAGYAAASGQSVLSRDVSSDERFAADVAASTRYVPRAMYVHPIERDDEALGVLSLLDPAASDTDLFAIASDIAAMLGPMVASLTESDGIATTMLRALDRVASDDAESDTAELFAEHGSTPRDAALAETASLVADLQALDEGDRGAAVRILREFTRVARRG